MQRSKIIYLRAHHLLCLQGFQGYGYDGPFTENLNEIHRIFFKVKKIKPIFLNDIVCKKCPFTSKRNQVCCKRNFNPKKFDLKILKILGIKPLKTVKLENLLFYSNQDKEKNIKLKNLCKDCEWKTKCLWFLN
ncbi:MAG: DUF1284 domain-containing protein [Brevinematales bacterium]|nr:DUF1284 domain-containing protein [Brevinematales bacterium]